MKNTFLLISLLTLSLNAWSQSGTVKVLDGKVVEGQFFFDKLYVFDTYQDGRISFNNGEHYLEKLNINTLTQTIRIISQKGDTISISTENNIDIVSSGGQFFKKTNNLYVQILNTSSQISLGLVRIMSIGKEKLEGAYGASMETSSVDKINLIDQDIRFGNNKSIIDVEYTYNQVIYLLAKNKMLIANKKNFEKIFPKQKVLISKYLEENNVKFSNKEDVILLFNYLIAAL